METLYNGIVLPAAWPPRTESPLDTQPMRVPYLDHPPEVIPIDIGRQLLVDDFLVEETQFARHFCRPVKHPGNPVFFPQSPAECDASYPPTAIPKCGGVWYDARDRQFKMWYMAGYLGAMAYATSTDGLHWTRPLLDVVPGTNLVLPRTIHPDSGTAWIDEETSDPSQRYKLLVREGNRQDRYFVPAHLFTSGDGVHWTRAGETADMDDRSTCFYNPFRKRWVQSIRTWIHPRGRARLYWEDADFVRSGQWQPGEPPFWTGADTMDVCGDARAQLYNLDAVAYESLMVGFFQILRGPPNQIGEARAEPKLTELVLATSRDGFHWHRPDRRPFIGARREPGSWEFGYVESTGGVCLVVGDELWFYYSAYAGEPTCPGEPWQVSGMYGNGAVGLAKLRRDGFVAMQARFAGADLLTRPLTFTGRHLFVNAQTAGARLSVECRDRENHPIEPFTHSRCQAFMGNATAAEVRWQGADTLAALAGRPVRFHFRLDRGELYAFWVSPSERGESRGYRGAGGPMTEGDEHP